MSYYPASARRRDLIDVKCSDCGAVRIYNKLFIEGNKVRCKNCGHNTYVRIK